MNNVDVRDGLMAAGKPRTLVAASNRTDKSIALYPSEHFKVTYSISFDHPLLQHQSMTLPITEESFVEEIAPARTFTFLGCGEVMR